MLLDLSAPAQNPLTPEERKTAADYLQWKCDLSWQNHDRFKAGDPRRPIPVFETPADASRYYFTDHGNPYTGDPLWGVVDFYTHPGRLQAALDAGKEAVARLFIDCDDVSLWYAWAIAKMPGYEAQIVTLIDHRVVGSHVVCLWRGHGRQGVVDTNGHRDLPDLTERTICDAFTAIYQPRGYVYRGACPSPTPWPENTP